MASRANSETAPGDANEQLAASPDWDTRLLAQFIALMFAAWGLSFANWPSGPETVLTGASAFLVAQLASAVTRPWTAFALGLAYILVLSSTNGSEGGVMQLVHTMIAASAFLVWHGRKGGGWQTPLAMVFVGIAVTFQSDAMFESLILAGVAIKFCWYRHETKTRVVERAVFWTTLILLPSLVLSGLNWLSGYSVPMLEAEGTDQVNAITSATTWTDVVLRLAAHLTPIVLLTVACWNHLQNLRQERNAARQFRNF